MDGELLAAQKKERRGKSPSKGKKGGSHHSLEYVKKNPRNFPGKKFQEEGGDSNVSAWVFRRKKKKRKG